MNVHREFLFLVLAPSCPQAIENFFFLAHDFIHDDFYTSTGKSEQTKTSAPLQLKSLFSKINLPETWTM